MTNIGTNNSGIPQNLLLGKEKGKFGKGIEDKQNALELAKIMPGSELVFQGKDGNWTVAELKEEGVFSGADDLHINDKSEIFLDNKALKSIGASNAVYSFFEEEASDAVKEKFASDPKTKKEVLAVLAKDENFEVKILVANNPNTSTETLKELSKPQPFKIFSKEEYELKHQLGGTLGTDKILDPNLQVEQHKALSDAVADNPHTSQ